MLEGIIIDVKLGDVSDLYVRRESIKEVLKARFVPYIYVLERDFYKFEKLFWNIILDTEYERRPIGLTEKKESFVKVFVTYRDYRKLIKIRDRLSFPIFNLDIYEEHLLIRVPSLNKVAIRIGKMIHGDYLWGLNPGIPEELRIIKIEKRGEIWFASEVSGEGIETYELLKDVIHELDPDIVVSEININRAGILSIDPRTYRDYGIAGILEKAYFSYAMPRRVLRLTIGNSVESRQEKFALDRGMVLPLKENGNVIVSRLRDYLALDAGGIVLTPKPGIYGNIVELDFTSMFPSIILKYNISYETCDLQGVSDKGRKGFLPRLVEEPYKRRLFFKKLRNEKAEKRAKILKLLLVAVYGCAGKLDNRFGNMYCNFWINKIAREILITTIKLAKEYGLRVIYADTDSVFITNGDTISDLIQTLHKKTGLPIRIANEFKKIAFVRGRNGFPVIKRYFGITKENKLIIKGLMAVHHNTPRIIKKAQIEMMKSILNGRPENIDKIFEEYHERILQGRLEPEDLVIEVRTGKHYKEYKINSIIAKIARKHKLRKGTTVKIIYTSNGAIRAENYQGRHSVKKYIEILERARKEITTKQKQKTKNPSTSP